MAGLADPQKGLANTDRLGAVDDNAPKSILAAIEERTVGTADILCDDPSGFVAEDTKVLGPDIGIVDDDVVIVSATDENFRTRNAKPGLNVAVARQYLNPDHLLTCTASRKRFPSAMASS